MSYVKDWKTGSTRWNRPIAKAGCSTALTLPSTCGIAPPDRGLNRRAAAGDDVRRG